MLTYSIVEFIEENTVEIILSSWILPDNQTTLWPPCVTSAILKKHLKCRTEPNTSWTTIAIRILGQADTLVDAEKKAQKAQDTSQLSSDSESEINVPLTRQKKLPFRYQISSDDEISEKPPKKQHETLESQSKRPIVPLFPEFQDSIEKMLENNIDGQENTDVHSSFKNTSAVQHESVNITTLRGEKGNVNKRLNYVQNTKDYTENLQISSASTSIPLVTNDTENLTPISGVSNINKKGPNYAQNTKEILIQIFKLIEEVRFEVTESRKEQQETKVQLETFLAAHGTGPFNTFSKILPISSMECFNEIESTLETSDDDYASLVKFLNLASGGTVSKLVPSVMKLLMTKTVAIQFSGCGRRKKQNFSATKIAGAVYDIILKKLPDSSKDEILKRISKFLAESGDREGGRKERLSK